MNPFDFVPVDFNRAIKRRPPAGHERLSGLTGEIACTITAETPILVKGKKVRDIFHFKKKWQ